MLVTPLKSSLCSLLVLTALGTSLGCKKVDDAGATETQTQELAAEPPAAEVKPVEDQDEASDPAPADTAAGVDPGADPGADGTAAGNAEEPTPTAPVASGEPPETKKGIVDPPPKAAPAPKPAPAPAPKPAPKPAPNPTPEQPKTETPKPPPKADPPKADPPPSSGTPEAKRKFRERKGVSKKRLPGSED